MNITLVNIIEFEPLRDFFRGQSDIRSTGYPPIGLMTLAAVLEAAGHQVEIIDFGNLILNGDVVYDDRFPVTAAEYIKERRPDVAGFSSRCDNYVHSLRMAEEFKALVPGTPVIFGGPQATITDIASMEKFQFIDAVVRHEAEYSFPALLDALKCDNPFEGIPGVVYRRDGKIQKNPDPPLILDLDQIPIPAFRHFPIETLDMMPIEVGRGCPFGCTFCVTNRYFNRRYRLKSADRIVDEVEFLQGRYGFKKFGFIHDMLTASRNLVNQLCKRILERGVEFEWSCSARTDCVDRELLEVMSAAGCRQIFCGIETGSPRMQKVVNKNLKLDTVFPAVDLCNEMGIAMTASFITGFPEEQEDDIEATLRMMTELSSLTTRLQLHLYSPTPGTPLNDKFADRLIYTGYISDFGFATSFGERDEKLIRENPDIFTNYFQVRPVLLDLDAISGLDVFGYCLKRFSHFFFYLANHPGTPGLVEFWNRLKRWIDETGLTWDMEAYLGGGLVAELERYIALLLSDSPEWPQVLTEAFNLDRSLIALESAVADLPQRMRAELETFNTSIGNVRRDGSIRLRLRSPLLITEARCNLSDIMESVRRRQFMNIELRSVPTPIGVFVAREGGRSRGHTFAFIELNELTELVLTAADRMWSIEELLTAASANGSSQKPQRVLAHAERLARLQAITSFDANQAGQGDVTRCAVIRRMPEPEPGFAPLFNSENRQVAFEQEPFCGQS